MRRKSTRACVIEEIVTSAIFERLHLLLTVQRRAEAAHENGLLSAFAKLPYDNPVGKHPFDAPNEHKLMTPDSIVFPRRRAPLSKGIGSY